MNSFFLLPEEDQALVWAIKSRAPQVKEVLLAFLPPRRRRKLDQAWEELESEELPYQNLVRESLFYHAHPSWITENFGQERPSILCLLLKDLPRATVGSILKDFSKEKRRQLKEEALVRPLTWVPGALKNLAEAKFPKLNFRALEEISLYKKIKGLSPTDLEKYFREVGLEEMILAFSQISRASLKALLHRLSVPDAKELRKRLKKAPAFTAEDQRQAQLHLLRLDMEKMKAEEVVKQIGLSLFARSFAKGERELGQYFVYKLPRQYGLLLRRLVNLHSAEASQERAETTRKRLMKSYHKLFRKASRT